jgi:surface antigen
MHSPKVILVAALFSFSLVACEGAGNKQVGGTLLGGALGGLAGSQIGSGKGTLVAVGLGALLGAFAGSEVGKSLDKADKAYARQTAHRALETTPAGTQTTWHNPDSGNQGTITPTTTYQKDDGTYCREFHQTVMIGGKEEQAYGTACRQPDGSWKMTDKK